VAEPTTDRDALLKKIDTLTTSRGTAIGLAILAAIDAIAETNSDVAPSGVDLGAGPGGAADAIAEYEPDTIVVLTDGANTQGVDPITAAEQAVPRHLRIYTIGFGTTGPAQMVCTPDQLGDDATVPGDGPGWGGFRGGGRRFLDIDEPTLTEVAEMTGGRYFRAQDSEQLIDVMTDLPTQIEVQREDRELTVWFVLGAALLVLLAVGLSLWWNRSPGVPRMRGLSEAAGS
jgi:Ca-activated chloride channel family protein